jgi:hypothetical protein
VVLPTQLEGSPCIAKKIFPSSDSYQNERLLIENFNELEKIKEGTCLDICANVEC